MMNPRTWCVLLLVAFVLFCTVRAVRRPVASEGAQSIKVPAGYAQLEEAATESQSTRLEAAGDAQQIRQQETANELRRRQLDATCLLSANPGVSADDAGG